LPGFTFSVSGFFTGPTPGAVVAAGDAVAEGDAVEELDPPPDELPPLEPPPPEPPHDGVLNVLKAPYDVAAGTALLTPTIRK
jgi:hypothetical protein